jgi:hypothetical protein
MTVITAEAVASKQVVGVEGRAAAGGDALGPSWPWQDDDLDRPDGAAGVEEPREGGCEAPVQQSGAWRRR